MKKIFAIFIGLLFLGNINAQKLGLEGGPIYSQLNIRGELPMFEDFDINISKTDRLGFYIGPTMHLGITDYLDAKTGLLFTYKGGVENINLILANLDIMANTFYVEIPLELSLKYPLRHNNFIINTGPSLNVLVADNNKVRLRTFGTDLTLPDQWMDLLVSDHLSRIETSWKVSAGIEFDRMEVRAIANIGLSNVFDSNYISGKNHYYGLGIGYKF